MTRPFFRKALLLNESKIDICSGFTNIIEDTDLQGRVASKKTYIQSYRESSLLKMRIDRIMENFVKKYNFKLIEQLLY